MTKEMICDLCRNSVPIAEIKYMLMGSDTRRLVCSECRAKGFSKDKKPAVPEPKKIGYICERCNYRFKAEADVRCPFCGRTDKVREHESISVDHLLNSNKEE